MPLSWMFSPEGCRNCPKRVTAVMALPQWDGLVPVIRRLRVHCLARSFSHCWGMRPNRRLASGPLNPRDRSLQVSRGVLCVPAVTAG